MLRFMSGSPNSGECIHSVFLSAFLLVHPLWQPTFMISCRRFYYLRLWGRFTPDGRKPPPLITSERPFGSNWIPRSFQDLCLWVVNWIMGLKRAHVLLFWSCGWFSFDFGSSLVSCYDLCMKIWIFIFLRYENVHANVIYIFLIWKETFKYHFCIFIYKNMSREGYFGLFRLWLGPEHV